LPKICLLLKEKRPAWVELFEKEGLEVCCDYRLPEAIDNILSQPPDLLIIEYELSPELVYDLLIALKTTLYLPFLPVLLVLSATEFQLDWERYPVDDFFSPDILPPELLARVHLAFARARRLADNNPLTGLPGNTSILKYIQDKLDKGEEIAIGYVDLDNFKPFNDRYGFARGDEILRALARILTNVVRTYAGDQGFVGHIGGDDFVFVCPLPKAEKIAQEIIDHFDQVVPNFLDEEDLLKGCFISEDRQGRTCRFPLPSVSIAIVPNRQGRYKHYGEISAVAAQIKKYVKQIPGSTYLLDRRKAKN